MKPGDIVKTKDGHVGQVEAVFDDFVSIMRKVTVNRRMFCQLEDVEVVMDGFKGGLDVAIQDEDDGYCD